MKKKQPFITPLWSISILNYFGSEIVLLQNESLHSSCGFSENFELHFKLQKPWIQQCNEQFQWREVEKRTTYQRTWICESSLNKQHQPFAFRILYFSTINEFTWAKKIMEKSYNSLLFLPWNFFFFFFILHDSWSRLYVTYTKYPYHWFGCIVLIWDIIMWIYVIWLRLQTQNECYSFLIFSALLKH